MTHPTIPPLRRLLLVGASGHARAVADAAERAGYTLVGFADSIRDVGSEFLGLPVLGRDTEVASVAERHAIEAVLVSVGDNFGRAQVAERIGAVAPEARFATVIHPDATIGRDVEIGPGSVVMAGAVIQPGARIGAHCIVNTRASVDHDCVLDGFASVAPGATLGGNVRVGHHSAVSIGASVAHRITIGEHTVVGAGAVVVRDLPANVVAYGVPARIVRERVAGDRYV